VIPISYDFIMNSQFSIEQIQYSLKMNPEEEDFVTWVKDNIPFAIFEQGVLVIEEELSKEMEKQIAERLPSSWKWVTGS